MGRTTGSRLTKASATERYLKANPASGLEAQRRARYLPGGYTRNSLYFPPYPPTISRGRGCIVEDVDGNQRVDFLNNYTALVLGHAPPAVVAAVEAATRRGSAFGAPTEYEAELARIISERVGSVELLRFATSGTEATMVALRTARAFTGRTMIGRFDGGYHGSHDYALAPGRGIPDYITDDICPLTFNDWAETEARITERADRLAAVIVEPALGAGGIFPGEPGFLTSLRSLTSALGILLIFDEVMMFRSHYQGAQAIYGVTPDLTTFGKIIGGGFPVAAVGGRGDVMEVHHPVHGSLSIGGTNIAHAVGLAAGIATLKELTPELIERMNTQAAAIQQRTNDVFAKRGFNAHVTRMGSIFNLHLVRSPVVGRPATQADSDRLALLMLALLNEGFYLASRGMGCISAPMTDSDVDAFVTAVDSVVEEMA